MAKLMQGKNEYGQGWETEFTGLIMRPYEVHIIKADYFEGTNSDMNCFLYSQEPEKTKWLPMWAW